MKHPKLKPVDPNDHSHLGYLFGVMARRLEEPDSNISHTKMPSWDEHCAFVRSKPYTVHRLITSNNWMVGVCYISKQNEVGIYVSPEYRNEGVATWAVGELMKSHNGPLFANVNPHNLPGTMLFFKLGFELKEQHPTQVVYVHAGKQG